MESGSSLTCGACHPEAFRTEKGARIRGYAVASDHGHLSTQIKRLHYLGAEHVFADFPVGRVKHRPNFKLLAQPSVYLRPGDTLLLADNRALGTKPARADAIIDDLTADGIEVCVIRPDYFDEQS